MTTTNPPEFLATLRDALDEIAHVPSYSIDARDAFSDAIERVNKLRASIPSLPSSGAPGAEGVREERCDLALADGSRCDLRREHYAHDEASPYYHHPFTPSVAPPLGEREEPTELEALALGLSMGMAMPSRAELLALVRRANRQFRTARLATAEADRGGPVMDGLPASCANCGGFTRDTSPRYVTHGTQYCRCTTEAGAATLREAARVGVEMFKEALEANGMIQRDGWVFTYTDDADLGVWAAATFNEEAEAVAMFYGDEREAEAFQWLAARATTREG